MTWQQSKGPQPGRQGGGAGGLLFKGVSLGTTPALGVEDGSGTMDHPGQREDDPCCSMRWVGGVGTGKGKEGASGSLFPKVHGHLGAGVHIGYHTREVSGVRGGPHTRRMWDG